MKTIINGEFAGYSSARNLSVIPFNFLTKGSFNCHVFNGEVKSREKIVHTNEDASTPYYKAVLYRGDYSRALFQSTPRGGGTSTLYEAGSILDTKFSLSPTLTMTKPFKSAYANNILYLSYGQSIPYKFFVDNTNSAEIEPNGIPQAPDITTPTFTSGTSGIGTNWTSGGTVFYRYSYVFKANGHEVEGNVGDSAGATVTSANGKVTVTFTQPTNTDAQNHITHYRLYFRVEGVYYLVDDYAVSGTGSTEQYDVTDGLDYDETFPAFVENEFGQEQADKTQLTDAHYGIAWHKGRMWYASTDGQTLHYSEPQRPEHVIRSLTVGEGSDGYLTDSGFTELISIGNVLLIVKKESIWALNGDDLDDFELSKIAMFGSRYSNMTFFHNGYLYGGDLTGYWRWALSGPKEYLTRQVQEDIDSSGISVGTAPLAKWTEHSQDYADFYSYAIDGITGYLWFGIGCTHERMLGILVYDPNSGRTVGVYKMAHTFLTTEALIPTIYIGHIPTDTMTATLTDTRYNIGVYDDITDGTEEDDFLCAIYTGMLVDEGAPMGRYTWETAKFYFSEWNGETWGYGIKLNGVVTALGTANFETVREKNIGRSGEELSLILSTTATSGSVTLSRLALNYEPRDTW